MAEIVGGTKFANALARLTTSLTEVGTLRVGFLRGAVYPNGVPVALIAAIQNYGAPRAGIPRRPFFSNMVQAKSPAWPEAIKTLLRSTNFDTRRTLMLTGEAIKGQLQQSIRDTNSPPLAPATIRRKGFSKPLIETAHMLNSASYEVK